MTMFATALGSASIDELADVRRLLHRAGASRRRLGFPMDGRVLDAPWPTILAAACLEISDELSRRGHLLGRCSSCLVELGPLADVGQLAGSIGSAEISGGS
jgi:hypothetical protein